MVQAPFTGTDVLAGVLGLLALLYLALWRRDREPGMGWFALAMALLGAWIFANELHAPTAAQLQPSPWFAPLLLGIAALCVGLVAYLDVPHQWRRRVLAALLLPLLFSGGLALAVAAHAVSLPRATVAVLTTGCVAGLGALVAGSLLLWCSAVHSQCSKALPHSALTVLCSQSSGILPTLRHKRRPQLLHTPHEEAAAATASLLMHPAASCSQQPAAPYPRC